jgi:hypothetical protein
MANLEMIEDERIMGNEGFKRDVFIPKNIFITACAVLRSHSGWMFDMAARVENWGCFGSVRIHPDVRVVDAHSRNCFIGASGIKSVTRQNCRARIC